MKLVVCSAEMRMTEVGYNQPVSVYSWISRNNNNNNNNNNTNDNVYGTVIVTQSLQELL